jgi:hypothetical protein
MTRLEELRALLDKAVAAQKALRTNLCNDTSSDNEAAWGKLSNALIHECAQLVAVAEAARNLEVRWLERDSMNFRIAMRRLEDALTPLLEYSKGGDANCLPTKVNTPQSDASNAAPVVTQAGVEALEAKSLYCIPPSCICHGDGLMGMKCDAPEHARLKSEINSAVVQLWKKRNR